VAKERRPNFTGRRPLDARRRASVFGAKDSREDRGAIVPPRVSSSAGRPPAAMRKPDTTRECVRRRRWDLWPAAAEPLVADHRVQSIHLKHRSGNRRGRPVVAGSKPRPRPYNPGTGARRGAPDGLTPEGSAAPAGGMPGSTSSGRRTYAIRIAGSAALRSCHTTRSGLRGSGFFRNAAKRPETDRQRIGPPPDRLAGQQRSVLTRLAAANGRIHGPDAVFAEYVPAPTPAARARRPTIPIREVRLPDPSRIM
jgi:hypothetical protein